MGEREFYRLIVVYTQNIIEMYPVQSPFRGEMYLGFSLAQLELGEYMQGRIAALKAAQECHIQDRILWEGAIRDALQKSCFFGSDIERFSDVLNSSKDNGRDVLLKDLAKTQRRAIYSSLSNTPRLRVRELYIRALKEEDSELKGKLLENTAQIIFNNIVGFQSTTKEVKTSFGGLDRIISVSLIDDDLPLYRLLYPKFVVQGKNLQDPLEIKETGYLFFQLKRSKLRVWIIFAPQSISKMNRQGSLLERIRDFQEQMISFTKKFPQV